MGGLVSVCVVYTEDFIALLIWVILCPYILGLVVCQYKCVPPDHVYYQC